jgi:hypothetical protein
VACGESCVYYRSRGTTSACLRCSDFVDNKKPRFGLGEVDVFELARLLKEKELKEKELKGK